MRYKQGESFKKKVGMRQGRWAGKALADGGAKQEVVYYFSFNQFRQLQHKLVRGHMTIYVRASCDRASPSSSTRFRRSLRASLPYWDDRKSLQRRRRTGRSGRA